MGYPAHSVADEIHNNMHFLGAPAFGSGAGELNLLLANKRPLPNYCEPVMRRQKVFEESSRTYVYVRSGGFKHFFLA
jgi:hypothetical protein